MFIFINKREFERILDIMSNFTDAMTALRAKLDALGTPTDPAHLAAIDKAVADLTTAETADAANIKDIQDGLAILTAPTPTA